MRQTIVVLFALLLWLPVSARGDDAKDESKKLDGTWVPAEAELGGEKLPEETLKMMKLELSGGKYVVTIGERTDKGTFKVDATAKPKAMDVTGTEGPNKGKTLLAIYEMKGGTLRICYDLTGKKRPTEFKSEAETRQFLVSYKREKK
jgi:uncharacterized protein (TIGR03067 family)